MSDLLRQLQQRHVPRTAVLYLGAGWVALEFIGFIVDNYALDRVLLDVSLFLIVLGFFVAIVVSAIVSSLLIGPWLLWSIRRRRAVNVLAFFDREASVSNLRAKTREEVIDEL